MSKTLARRVDALEAGRGGVDAQSRFLIAFGEDARRDEVVKITDTVACRSHRRRLGEPADEFASRALVEVGEPWTPTEVGPPEKMDLAAMTDAQLRDILAVLECLEGGSRP
mgnify:CR=1 FL=1